MDLKEYKPVFRICNDDVFKEIFSRVPNALAALISDTLNIDYFLLKDNIQLERNELNKNNVENKSTTCDFIVKLEDKYKINIEINTSKYKGLDERNFLFVSRLFSNMIPKGTNYADFVNYRVAQLNINRFSNVSGRVISRIMLTDLDSGTPVIPSVTLYNFDIVKCYNIYYNEIESDIQHEKLIRWGTMLNTEKIEDIDSILGDDIMEKADKERFIEVTNELKGNYVNFTKEQLEQHEEFTREGMRLAAIEEGMEAGLKQGIEQGIEQGIKQGIEQKNIEVVTNMLKENIDINLITKVTGLTEEEIMKIKESL